MEKKDGIILKKIEEIGGTYRIQANIETRCISLVIIQELGGEFLVFKTSTILEQNLKAQAGKLLMDLDAYFKKLISFFENPCGVKFDINEYTLTIIENVNSNIQVNYFQCKLEKVSNSYIGSLIDDLHSQKSQSEIQCKELIYKNELLQEEVIEYKNKLNELVARKISDEKTMLSNFVSLLNEKKRRIQHLNELLEAFRDDSSSVHPVEVNMTYTNKKKLKNIESVEQTPQVKEEISESESEDSHLETMTDDEHLADSTKSEKISSMYSELFDVSPTEINSPIIKFPKLNTPGSSKNIHPSTSKEINSDMGLNEEIKSPLIQSHDFEPMNVDTQKWLNNL